MLNHPSQLIHPFRDQVIEILDKSGLYAQDPMAKSAIAAVCRQSVPENLGPNTISTQQTEDLQAEFFSSLMTIFPECNIANHNMAGMSNIERMHFNEQDKKLCVASAAFMLTMSRMTKVPTP